MRENSDKFNGVKTFVNRRVTNIDIYNKLEFIERNLNEHIEVDRKMFEKVNLKVSITKWMAGTALTFLILVISAVVLK